ncbi:MAG TPA: hypothetical protein PKD12_17845 [Nitrospira sp.]|nr:hypothetical protein [Nitrospira sp.]
MMPLTSPMSSTDLQRLTESLSDIGQPSPRRSLPSRRNHITQKVRIADQRTLYVSVHDDPSPAEVFLRIKGPDCTPETIALYDVIARLMSVALQYGASLEKIGDLLTGAQFGPCGSVSGHDRLKHCSSLPDLIGRHLLVEYCGRDELAHVPPVNVQPINQGGASCTESDKD